MYAKGWRKKNNSSRQKMSILRTSANFAFRLKKNINVRLPSPFYNPLQSEKLCTVSLKNNDCTSHKKKHAL